MKKAIILLVVIWLFSYGLYKFRSSIEVINEDTISHEEFVDLNLPSGILWASKNIGANKPEDIGNLYAWGETEIKDHYYQTNYKFYSGDILPKSPNYYNEETIKVDDIGNNIQGTKYDVSTMTQGERSCMPSDENIIELIKECKWTNAELNGVRGYKIAGNNGRAIFMPYSYYWSSNINSKDYLQAIALRIDGSLVETVGRGRRFGLNVRAIYRNKE